MVKFDSAEIVTGHIAAAFLGGLGGPATLRQYMAARAADEKKRRVADAAEETAAAALSTVIGERNDE